MNTKNIIKQKALELFNDKGMLNVTLREVGAKLGKSYGNITYHYKTKEHVVAELYTDMVNELKTISVKMMGDGDMFNNMINVPAHTYDLSVKYLFLFKDFVEIKRSYPKIAALVDTSNALRKSQLKQLLVALQNRGLLRDDLDDDGLDYLMELSGAIRAFFFLSHSNSDFKKSEMKAAYIEYVNKLLLPYLTLKGKQRYYDAPKIK